MHLDALQDNDDDDDDDDEDLDALPTGTAKVAQASSAAECQSKRNDCPKVVHKERGFRKDTCRTTIADKANGRYGASAPRSKAKAKGGKQ